MRLKTLEIKGFKSFADKTTLNFDEGITGVIGPNGCGKSNIIDSIRWVIGEHKISNLRSENLESLVFNGSKSRNASGLAEVSLTFENTKNLLPTEFNTVTITRRYYKSGESEYRLNDVACRLKDIHNLFLDTGVSTDSYAIIELGMVDDIIKDKENSRRRMLEQAAGITIYKTRKKEAKLKLDATEQDLARIEDLLFEINNQLKSLESQARKAERYFEVKKEYKELSIELAKAALQGFNITYKTLNEQQKQEMDRRLELEAAIALEDAELEKDKAAFIESEKELQLMQQDYNKLLDEARSVQNEKSLTSQKLQHLKERKGSLDAFLEKAGGQIAGLQEGISFTQQQLEDEQDKIIALEEKLEDQKEVVEEKRKVFDEKRSGIDALRKDYSNKQREQFDAEKTVAVADITIQNQERTIHQLEEEKTNRSIQLKNLDEENAAKVEQLQEKQERLAQMQKQHEDARAKIFDTQNLMEGLRQSLAEENRMLDAKSNEYALLKSLVDSMEGYPESVKYLTNNKEWAKRNPLLSDILYVKEEYRAALESLLEPYLNYYVADNLQVALEAVHLLHQNNKGKANFFLLDEFNSSNVVDTPQGLLPALDVVEFDKKYAPLVEWLLAKVFITEQEADIENTSDIVVVDKAGKFVRSRYSLTGGSVGIFEGRKIGRAKNLEKLSSQISLLTEKVTQLKADIQQKHNDVIGYNALIREQDLRHLQNEINQLTNTVFALQNKTENLRHQDESAQARVNDLKKNLQANRDDISGTKEILESLNVQLEGLKAGLDAAESAYSSAEQAYNFATAALNDSNLQITRQQSKIASLKQELTFKTNQVSELKAQVEQSQAQSGQSEKDISETSQTLKELEDAVVTVLQKKESEEKRVNLSEQAYHNQRNHLVTRESTLRSKQKNKEQIDTLLTEIKDKLSELKLQLAGIKERLHVEFRVDIDDIIDEERTGDAPFEDLQERSEKLRKRIENIGEVNPTAIEAYTEMKKRYEFILEQKNDLVSAKDILLQTIQEVEATANQQFLTTFNQVRDNFQKVFKALFTEEDTADMVLVDPDNLAETGIDIVAKPKGKRPSSIGQLSGGEKTLTATALLFAIYLIKPAPFCILDEVDAPLDDANVGKFTNMIRRFSENSQFIIVTHNKQTMGAVDVIYGVTMQEAGVSKLVPVDFRSLN